MTPQECTDGRPRRRRARDGYGDGRGDARRDGRRARRSGGDGRGRGTSLSRGAAASAAAFVAKDVLDPDGLVRPMLRGAAERLQNSPSRLLCRAGARYLELDPHPVELIEPVSAAAPEGGRTGAGRASLPAYEGEMAEPGAADDAVSAADVEAEAGAETTTEADAVWPAEEGAPTAEGREAPPA